MASYRVAGMTFEEILDMKAREEAVLGTGYCAGVVEVLSRQKRELQQRVEFLEDKLNTIKEVLHV